MYQRTTLWKISGTVVESKFRIYDRPKALTVISGFIVPRLRICLTRAIYGPNWHPELGD